MVSGDNSLPIWIHVWNALKSANEQLKSESFKLSTFIGFETNPIINNPIINITWNHPIINPHQASSSLNNWMVSDPKCPVFFVAPKGPTVSWGESLAVFSLRPRRRSKEIFRARVDQRPSPTPNGRFNTVYIWWNILCTMNDLGWYLGLSLFQDFRTPSSKLASAYVIKHYRRIPESII